MTLQQSVIDVWQEFISDLEGVTNWMYFDTHKDAQGNPDPWPTTGIGNLIGHSTGLNAFGYSLPWRFEDGRWATELQIKQEFTRQKGFKNPGKDGFAWEVTAQLFLDWDDVNFIVKQKLLSNQDVLKKSFPDLDKWPASAQLAVNNMAWLMGPAFAETYDDHPGWPKLRAALREQNFFIASAQCWTGDDPKHTHKRNVGNSDLFRAAGAVRAAGMNYETLWYTVPKATVKTGTDQLAWAATQISMASWTAAVPATFSLTGWYVQRALAELGFYTTTIDGLVGKWTRAAFTEFRTKVVGKGNERAAMQALMNKTYYLLVV